MIAGEAQGQIERIRRFNRSYSQRIGIVNMVGSGLSLAAARVLLEIDRGGQVAAVDIARPLELDPGYLSRIVSQLDRRGLIRKRRSPRDGRRRHLELTRAGRRTLVDLTERTNARIGAMLEPIPAADRESLIGAMTTIERILGQGEHPAPCRIHDHGPGDLGWVVYRHGSFYGRQLGLDESFEALVTRIAAGFAEGHDPRRERLWIAEQDGENVGSVMLTRETEQIGRLRLFWVEARARGQGVGWRLLETCIEFARRRAYRRIVLSTLESLHAARRLYERAGFRLAETRSHDAWGPRVVEESWELELA